MSFMILGEGHSIIVFEQRLESFGPNDTIVFTQIQSSNYTSIMDTHFSSAFRY
jgi:hypothetical protein